MFLTVESISPIIYLYLNYFTYYKQCYQTYLTFGLTFFLGYTLIQKVLDLYHPNIGLGGIPLFFHCLFFLFLQVIQVHDNTLFIFIPKKILAGIFRYIKVFIWSNIGEVLRFKIICTSDNYVLLRRHLLQKNI